MSRFTIWARASQLAIIDSDESTQRLSMEGNILSRVLNAYQNAVFWQHCAEQILLAARGPSNKSTTAWCCCLASRYLMERGKGLSKAVCKCSRTNAGKQRSTKPNDSL